MDTTLVALVLLLLLNIVPFFFKSSQSHTAVARFIVTR